MGRFRDRVKDKLSGHKEKYEDIGREHLIEKMEAKRERLKEWIREKENQEQALQEVLNLAEKSRERLPDDDPEVDDETLKETEDTLWGIEEEIKMMMDRLDDGLELRDEDKETFDSEVDYLIDRAVENIEEM